MARLNAELVGSRIKARREDLKLQDEKWTQPYVAHEINERTGSKLQGADISRWETGRHLPNRDHMEALAEVLDTTVAEFYASPSNGAETPDPLDDQGEEDVLSAIQIELAATREALQIIARTMRPLLDEKDSRRMRELREQLGLPTDEEPPGPDQETGEQAQ